MDLSRLIAVLILIAIIVSLGSALRQLSKPGGDPQRMLRALTLRVGLSVGLFVLLLIGWKVGLIQPHGLGQ
jgi:hypothetical protein